MQRLLAEIARAYREEANSLTTDGWHISRAAKGMNGIVYRAQHDDGRDWAVKISKRDERDRSGREFNALKALHRLNVAPLPIELVREPADLPGDVVITEWLAGTRLETLPQSHEKDRWQALLKSMSAPHHLTPETIDLPLRNAVTHIRQPGDLLDSIDGWYGRFPKEVPADLSYEQITQLVQTAHAQTPHEWASPAPIALIHCDSNPHNVIEDQGIMRLVDWENAGWADPAFDIADLCAQPNYGVQLPDAHHIWIREAHSRLLDDPTLPERAAVYQRLLLVWWVVRLSGYLNEAANARLAGVPRPNDETTITRRAVMWTKASEAFGM